MAQAISHSEARPFRVAAELLDVMERDGVVGINTLHRILGRDQLDEVLRAGVGRTQAVVVGSTHKLTITVMWQSTNTWAVGDITLEVL